MSITTIDDEQSLRQQFHDWLLTQGFAQQETPPAGKSYRGSHLELLWQCYRHATQAERARNSPQNAIQPLHPLEQARLDIEAHARTCGLTVHPLMDSPGQSSETPAEQLPLLERMANAHDERLRASGYTVVETSPKNSSSPTQRLTATFVPAPRSSSSSGSD